jgi:hypothetical protein
LVDVSGFKGKRSGRIDGRDLGDGCLFGRIVRVGRCGILGRICCIFVDSNSIEWTAIPLVKEKIVPFPDDNNIPWIYRSWSAHEDAQNDIRCIYLGDVFTHELAGH